MMNADRRQTAQTLSVRIQVENEDWVENWTTGHPHLSRFFLGLEILNEGEFEKQWPVGLVEGFQRQLNIQAAVPLRWHVTANYC